MSKRVASSDSDESAGEVKKRKYQIDSESDNGKFVSF